jgi:hypothetical protein
VRIGYWSDCSMDDCQPCELRRAEHRTFYVHVGVDVDREYMMVIRIYPGIEQVDYSLDGSVDIVIVYGHSWKKLMVEAELLSDFSYPHSRGDTAIISSRDVFQSELYAVDLSDSVPCDLYFRFFSVGLHYSD